LTTSHLAATHCDYANELLKEFVEEFSEIYGAQGLVYNVHNLCHVADDCKKYGALDSISAFPFENYLKTIKGLLRHGNKPLHQLSRRYAEIHNLGSSNAVRPGLKNVKARSLVPGSDFGISTAPRDRNVLLQSWRNYRRLY
jgi:hypothetical protein